jgi:hypothetical protein
MRGSDSSSQTFAPALRALIAVTAAIDLLVGLAWLLGPELGLALWPTPIPPALMRFIGAIVFANGVGAMMIVRRPTWENARTLFTVAFAYGILVLLGLLYQLLVLGAPSFLWLYIAVDMIFLVPIGYIIWANERGSLPSKATPAQSMSGGSS